VPIFSPSSRRISEDTEQEARVEVQKVTDNNIKEIDELVSAKEKEILTV
jgi:ribosome recycling factor